MAIFGASVTLFHLVLFVVGGCVCEGLMSNVCSFCQSKESMSACKWFVCVDCVGRRVPPSAARDSRVDNGYASSSGTWPPGASSPSRCNI